ncbi:MAG: YHS domain-containing (seleno)protein [Saprospiraceae bacterium]
MNLFIIHILWNLISLTVIPGEPIQRQKHFRLTSAHVALDGYDPVSYFQSGPVKGKQKISFDQEGVKYFFTNETNKSRFSADPSKYEPAWGGWCGHAMAVKGEKVEINPLCYKIIQGINVLFYKTFWANALTNWEKEIKTTPENTLMKKGDDVWNSIVIK